MVQSEPLFHPLENTISFRWLKKKNFLRVSWRVVLIHNRSFELKTRFNSSNSITFSPFDILLTIGFRWTS